MAARHLALGVLAALIVAGEGSAAEDAPPSPVLEAAPGVIYQGPGTYREHNGQVLGPNGVQFTHGRHTYSPSPSGGTVVYTQHGDSVIASSGVTYFRRGERVFGTDGSSMFTHKGLTYIQGADGKTVACFTHNGLTHCN